MRLLICVPLLLAGCIAGGDDVPIRQVGSLENRDLDEASGLARSTVDADLLWAINDDGAPTLYGLSRSGKHCGRVAIDDASNEDWEDLAAFEYDGKSYLAVADIGDNESRRPHVTLYIVAEPGSDEEEVPLAWQVNFRYPNGPRDAESLAVDVAGGFFYILSKRDIPAVLYAVPLRPGSGETVIASQLALISSLPQPSKRQKENADKSGWPWQPTAMDFAADGRSALVLTYGGVYYFARGEQQSWPEALTGTALELKLGKIKNAEAIAVDEHGMAAFLTVEKQHAPVFRIDLADAHMWHISNIESLR
ncbi:MAG: hypothetical protein O2907_07055 [Proteobacteria bacterium]|nr:hypothetical protein [Pseudomonadota bacterium]MDA1064073.1 hypothetical protein [Pseudomonadota bacterium]